MKSLIGKRCSKQRTPKSGNLRNVHRILLSFGYFSPLQIKLPLDAWGNSSIKGTQAFIRKSILLQIIGSLVLSPPSFSTVYFFSFSVSLHNATHPPSLSATKEIRPAQLSSIVKRGQSMRQPASFLSLGQE